MSALESLEHASWTVMGRAGLIRRCQNLPHDGGQPKLYACTATTSKVDAGELARDGFGAGFTFEEAALSAVGESLERYAGACHDPGSLVIATPAELGAAAVGTDELRVYSDEQYAQPRFPFRPLAPDRPLRWTRGRSLVDGRERFVPASTVFIPYEPLDAHDFLCFSVSSGQACHVDRDAAILSGLCEVIERDAFVISWLRKLPLPAVDFLADAELAALYRRHLAAPGVRYQLLDMTHDLGVPSYVCLVEGRSARGGLIAMGAATRLDAREAAKKAMIEAAQDLLWCHHLLRALPDWRPAPGFTNVRDFADHVRLYCEPEMREHVAFWLDRPATGVLPASPTPMTLTQSVDSLVRRVAAAGLDVIVVDTTPRDVADSGFLALKVVVPGTATLSAVHEVPALGSPRLWSVPATMGLVAGATVNPSPHPFP